MDPNASIKSGGGAIGAAADTVDALLYKYMRFYV